MPRDHYVAETYLKHFVGKTGMLHAYRKTDGKKFPCHPSDICHEWDGDIIPDFLDNPKLLGEYRKIFEPVWNPVLQQLQAGTVSFPDKVALAGYIGNLLVCTPAWRSIGIEGYNFARRNI